MTTKEDLKELLNRCDEEIRGSTERTSRFERVKNLIRDMEKLGDDPEIRLFLEKAIAEIFGGKKVEPDVTDNFKGKVSDSEVKLNVLGWLSRKYVVIHNLLLEYKDGVSKEVIIEALNCGEMNDGYISGLISRYKNKLSRIFGVDINNIICNPFLGGSSAVYGYTSDFRKMIDDGSIIFKIIGPKKICLAKPVEFKKPVEQIEKDLVDAVDSELSKDERVKLIEIPLSSNHYKLFDTFLNSKIGVTNIEIKKIIKCGSSSGNLIKILRDKIICVTNFSGEIISCTRLNSGDKVKKLFLYKFTDNFRKFYEDSNVLFVDSGKGKVYGPKEVNINSFDDKGKINLVEPVEKDDNVDNKKSVSDFRPVIKHVTYSVEFINGKKVTTINLPTHYYKLIDVLSENERGLTVDQIYSLVDLSKYSRDKIVSRACTDLMGKIKSRISEILNTDPDSVIGSVVIGKMGKKLYFLTDYFRNLDVKLIDIGGPFYKGQEVKKGKSKSGLPSMKKFVIDTIRSLKKDRFMKWEVVEICVAHGYLRKSLDAYFSILVKEKILEKGNVRGEYIVLKQPIVTPPPVGENKEDSKDDNKSPVKEVINSLRMIDKFTYNKLMSEFGSALKLLYYSDNKWVNRNSFMEALNVSYQEDFDNKIQKLKKLICDNSNILNGQDIIEGPRNIDGSICYRMGNRLYKLISSDYIPLLKPDCYKDNYATA